MADSDACRKRRRETNGAADAHVGTAAAQVRDGVDVFRCRVGRALEKGDRGQDLARLAVTALRDVLFQPGLLDRMQAGGAEPFDGRDTAARNACDRQQAGALRLALDEHGAGAAETAAAAEFRAGQAGVVAQVPQERHVFVAVE